MFNKRPFERLIERYNHEFENLRMYGVPITELNKEELMASIYYLVKKQQEHAENIKQERTTLAALRRLR